MGAAQPTESLRPSTRGGAAAALLPAAAAAPKEAESADKSNTNIVRIKAADEAGDEDSDPDDAPPSAGEIAPRLLDATLARSDTGWVWLKRARCGACTDISGIS